MLKSTSALLRNKGLARPTVVLDETRARANIARMADRAERAGALFRPHFKTHQSAAVGRWYAEAGVSRITVSSLDMAERFADCGWRDITVALLHNPLETDRANRLAGHLAARGGQLGLLVDDAEVAAGLSQALTAPVAIWLKIDTGYGRTGIRWDDTARLREVLAAVGGRAVPAGLLTHAGHSYHVQGAAAVRAVYDESISRMTAALAACGRKGLLLSLGDTPCCSLVDDLSACDEIRPGNFVFGDLMQLRIGACTEADLAAAVACPVLAVYPERRELVIHGGAVHLSKESLPGDNGRPICGQLGTVTTNGFGQVCADAPVVSLSQEHGIVAFGGAFPDTLRPGDLVLVWPVHSCLCCDLLRSQMDAPVTI